MYILSNIIIYIIYSWALTAHFYLFSMYFFIVKVIYSLFLG